MRMAWLVGLWMVLGCHADTPRRLCQRDIGCLPPQPLAPCPADLGPTTSAQTAAAQAPAGEEILVRGVLRREYSCTQLLCECCNTCGGSLSLDSGDWRTPVRLEGPWFRCQGDDSLVCCRLDAENREVVARGRVRRHGRHVTLEDATVCAPAP